MHCFGSSRQIEPSGLNASVRRRYGLPVSARTDAENVVGMSAPIRSPGNTPVWSVLEAIALASGNVKPTIQRFDVDRMDEDDNRLFDLIAQVQRIPKPASQPRSRMPFVVRN